MKYDKKALYKKCQEHNIEPLEITKKNMIIFMCPKMPGESIKEELLKDISNYQYRFLESPKTATRDGLEVLLKTIGFCGHLLQERRKLTIILNALY